MRTIFKSGNDLEYIADMMARMYRAKDLLHIAAPTFAPLRLALKQEIKVLSVVPFILQYRQVATYFTFMAVFRLIKKFEDTKY